MACMLCCIPSPVPQKRPKIDRFAIGNPTQFRHIAHLGSTALSESAVTSLSGGLDEQPLPIHLKLIDLPNRSESPAHEPELPERLISDEDSYFTTLLRSISRPPFYRDSYLQSDEPRSSRLLESENLIEFPKSADLNRLNETEGQSAQFRSNLTRSSYVESSSESKPTKSNQLDLSIPLPPPPPPPHLYSTRGYNGLVGSSA